MSVKLVPLFTAGKHDVLFIDPSASHLAYVFGHLDLEKKVMNLKYIGMVWTENSFKRGRRFRYMHGAIEMLATRLPADSAIVTEQYFSNPRMLTGGTAVIPTVNAFLEMAADRWSLAFQEIGAASWRSILGIKMVKANGKRDYKQPTADGVRRLLGKDLPLNIPSNINGKMRKLPNDVTDVLAIALAFAKHHGVVDITMDADAFHPTEILMELSGWAKSLA